MSSKEEFVEVENRIRSLTMILNNFGHRVSPSSDPKGLPSFLQHFANLLSTGHRNSPEAAKVVAVTGFLLPDGKTSALVITQDPSSKSDVRNLCIEDVSKSRKSFDEIVDLNR
ncbi:hypothetical protein M405DRAFT_938840 [Rhizopogon salebrosus TDB-379]|jgi:hypothetical protein|nr:hypothetical protein M405DRAFT_938840 [Rhizopogon salebrosus TDB-379]